MTKPSALRAQRYPAAVPRDPQLEVQPFLLDRLTNLRSQTPTASDGFDSPPRTQVRESVLRDLGWLLNCTNLEATDNLNAYPHVRRSVLNFGMSALTGARTPATGWSCVENAIREAIVQFEPRIVAESLEVRCAAEPSAAQRRNTLSLEICGQWCANPSPQPFLLHLDLDLESGHIALRSHGNRNG